MTSVREASDRFAGRFGVLIADDDAGSRDSLREALDAEAYEMFLAACGREALDLLRHVPVHIMLLDLHLPDMTGLALLRTVARIGLPRPSILMSGDLTVWDRREALLLEASAVLPKPVNLGVLRVTVRQVLRRRYPAAGPLPSVETKGDEP